MISKNVVVKRHNRSEVLSPAHKSSHCGLSNGSKPKSVPPALIRWSAEDLARHSAVSVTTIRRAELMPSATALTRANDQALRRPLEQAGVEFIDAENGGPGVRLRAPPR
jgi:hypothetical protein